MFQSLRQSAKISIFALLLNKGRSFLTMLGSIIGVAAVVIIMSIGDGAESMIVSQVQTLGTDLVGVIPGHSESDSPFGDFMGFSVTTLTYDDALALREKSNVPNAREVVAYSKGVATVVWGSSSYSTNVNGVTSGYMGVEGGELAVGRFIMESEETNLSRVAVLGSTVKDELFGASEAVGRRIKIKQQSFEVIGVMSKRGTVAMEDYDDQIFLPLKTAQRLHGINHVGLIRLKIDDEKNIGRAMSDIQVVLRERHNITNSSGRNDDFTVRSALEAMETIKTVTDALTYFLAAIAALSLLVGGIGVMNIMLISVTERTREVGLRKAVGADRFHILTQFVMESITITLLGGILGIILGVIISYGLALAVHFMGFDWLFVVSFTSIFLALTVSTLVGLFFGLYPAMKASRLDPILALRYE